ncbi:hypothetical protein RJT34_23639 [Clitoria ternatea]|uniref:Uncharacterized protein n=1 Tax=Clitoria ternatea TaxID=43366 RepID=A0AAN9FLF6_CLITE
MLQSLNQSHSTQCSYSRVTLTPSPNSDSINPHHPVLFLPNSNNLEPSFTTVPFHPLQNPQFTSDSIP